jgi:uncharacterized protein YjbJ (UPF0337 family)
MTDGTKDKAEGLVDKVTGKAKEATGKATGDTTTEVEGQDQQDKGAFKKK